MTADGALVVDGRVNSPFASCGHPAGRRYSGRRGTLGEASSLLLRARDRGCPHFRGREPLGWPASPERCRTVGRHGSLRRSVEADPSRVAAPRAFVRPVLGRACDLGGGLADHLGRRADPRLSADRLRAQHRRAGSAAGRPVPALRPACGRDRRSCRPPPHHGRLQHLADGRPRDRSARRRGRCARRRAGLRRRDRLRHAVRLVRRRQLRRAAADRRARPTRRGQRGGLGGVESDRSRGACGRRRAGGHDRPRIRDRPRRRELRAQRDRPPARPGTVLDPPPRPGDRRAARPPPPGRRSAKGSGFCGDTGSSAR